MKTIKSINWTLVVFIAVPTFIVTATVIAALTCPADFDLFNL